MERAALARWGNYARHDALIRFASTAAQKSRGWAVVKLQTPKRVCWTAFEEWRMLCDRMAVLRAAARRVVRKRTGRVLKRAVWLWRRASNCLACQRRRLKRRCALMMRESMRRWRDWVFMRTTLASAVEACWRRKRMCRLSHAVRGWVTVVALARVRNHAVRVLQSRCKFGALTEVLAAWEDAAALLTARRKAKKVISARAAMLIIAAAWDGWTAFYFRRKQQKRSLEKAMRSMRASVGNAEVKVWMWSSLVKLSQARVGVWTSPNLLSKFISRSVCRLQRWAVRGWAEWARGRVRRRKCEMRVARRCRGRLCTLALKEWADVVETRAVLAAAAGRVSQKRLQLVARAVLRGWRYDVDRSLCLAALLERSLERSHIRGMSRLFHAWLDVAEECKEERLLVTRLWRRAAFDGMGG